MKKTTKRILSFVLSCVFMCSGFVSTTAEEANTIDKAKNLLAALNIVSDNTNDFVTRERFADIYVRANNMYQEGYIGKNPFDDTVESDYAASIHMMRDYGIINGVGNNLFAPDENMIARDIIRLYIAALGLDTYQVATGKSYNEIAYEINLLKGVVVSEYITMDNLIQMTYNFLMAPVGVNNYTQQASYSIDYDTNVLYEKFDIYKIIGRVTQNEFSGIWSQAGAEDGYVSIKTKDGELTVLAGESGIGAMLGRTVDAYLLEGEEESTVVCYEKRDSDNSLVIDIKDIEFDVTDNSTIGYYKEGRKSVTKEKLASFPAFIINSVYYDADQFDIKELENYSGKIELISTDRSDYDVVLVEAYTNYYVENVEHYDGEMRIYDKGSDRALILNKDVYKNMEIYFPNGASASPFELKSGMLLSVAKSFGSETYVQIYISDDIEEGIITKCDLDEKIITLDHQKEYNISPAYSATNVPLGQAAKLYINKFGDVAWIEYDKTAIYSYAYMIEPRINYDDVVEVKVVVETGKFTTMHLAKKVTIDGEIYKTSESQLVQLENVQKFPNLSAGQYPFRYRMNDEGEIREIDTPRVRAGYESKDSFRLDSSGEKVHCSNDKILGKQTPLSSNTVMFLIPNATATEELENPAFFSIGNSSLLNTGGDNTYTAFKIGSDSLYVDLVIRTQQNMGGGMNHDNVMFLVEKVMDIYDQKYNEIRTKVTGLEAGARKEYYVHELCDRTKLDGLGRGDVVRFNFYNGEISALDRVFIYDDDTSENAGKYYLPTGGQKASSISQTGTSYYYAGYVMRREGKLIEILPFDLNAGSQDTGTPVSHTPDWSIETRRVFEAPNAISIYDPSLGADEAIYVGDLEDIPAYEDSGRYAKVIVRYRSRSAREMVVLKD